MLTNRDDVKIFILYLLNNLGYSIEYGVLHDMSVQDGFITSFDFIEAFDELLKNENIEKKTGEDGAELVDITENGKHIADTLHVRLLASVREKAMKSALRLLSFKKKGTKITASGSALPRGKYEFKCSIGDNGGEIMELKLVFDTEKELDRAIYNFDSRPEFMYRGIMALLSGEADYLLD